MKPQEQIVPIVGMNPGGKVGMFLGTGCFLQRGGVLLTADHVIRGWTGALAITTMKEIPSTFPATIVLRDEATDLAILTVEGYAAPSPIVLGEDAEIQGNQQVVSYEYGTTRVVGGNIVLQPATRIGNVARKLNLTKEFGEAGRDALELSFPALGGASGSPILSNPTFRLWGVVIANVSYHLLPAQIETIVSPEGNLQEETRYLLPQAVAVHVMHVSALLDRAGY